MFLLGLSLLLNWKDFKRLKIRVKFIQILLNFKRLNKAKKTRRAKS